MKKETSDNLLQEKMDTLYQADFLNARKYQTVWTRLEDELHPKNKRKAIHFYFAAAAILVVIFTGFIIRYQLNDKQQRQSLILYLPVKKPKQVVQSKGIANVFVHPAKSGQFKPISNKKTKKKITIAMPKIQVPEVTKQEYKPATNIAIPKREVVNNNLIELPAAIISQNNSIAAAPEKKPILKVMHLNEIYNGSTIKTTEIIKEQNVNWLFTTNNLNPDIRKANNHNQPESRKKSFFSVPLQKQNSD